MAEEKPRLSEDWLAVWIGLAIFAISLSLLAGVDLLGWAVKTNVWLQPSEVLSPISKAYAWCPGLLSLLATYVFLLVVTALGAAALAGMAVGTWPDLDALARCIRRGARYEPAMPREEAELRRGEWRRALQRALSSASA